MVEMKRRKIVREGKGVGVDEIERNGEGWWRR